MAVDVALGTMLEQGGTLPAPWYSDPGIHALERERVFARTWQFVGPTEWLDRDGACQRALQCPYHAWTYGLDGALRTAPRAQLEADFDPSGLGLVPVAVDTFGPLVFVNPDPAAAPLAEALGRLGEHIAASGVDL